MNFIRKIKHKKWKLFCIGVLLIIGIIPVARTEKEREKEAAKIRKTYMLDTSTFFRYENQSYHLGDYIITLKSGIYSEDTKNGICEFEVSKENGKMPEPQYRDELHCVDTFGDKEHKFSIMLNGTGDCITRGHMDNGKLILYTYFTASIDKFLELRAFNKNQLYLKYEQAPVDNVADKAYGFKLEDNIGGKTYSINDKTKLIISYLGVQVLSNGVLDNCKVEVVGKDKEKETLLNSEGEADPRGYYREYYIKDGGRKYQYSYTFYNMYDTDEIKEIYVNGKKVEEQNEEKGT